MDEISQAQLEEMARQGRYLSKWLEDNSTLDTTRLAYAALAASDVSSAAIRAMDSIAIASEALVSQVLIAEAAINW
jgi:hypothetical protein